MNNVVTTLAPSFSLDLFIIADSKDTHKISDGFEIIWQDPIRDL